MLLLPDLMGQRPNWVSWITFDIRPRILPQVVLDGKHKKWCSKKPFRMPEKKRAITTVTEDHRGIVSWETSIAVWKCSAISAFSVAVGLYGPPSRNILVRVAGASGYTAPHSA
jgi:hypothetical protein